MTRFAKLFLAGTLDPLTPTVWWIHDIRVQTKETMEAFNWQSCSLRRGHLRPCSVTGLCAPQQRRGKGTSSHKKVGALTHVQKGPGLCERRRGLHCSWLLWWGTWLGKQLSLCVRAPFWQEQPNFMFKLWGSLRCTHVKAGRGILGGSCGPCAWDVAKAVLLLHDRPREFFSGTVLCQSNANLSVIPPACPGTPLVQPPAFPIDGGYYTWFIACHWSLECWLMAGKPGKFRVWLWFKWAPGSSNV